MNDRYYAFNQGRKRGPFSLDDLLDETERGQVEYEDLCLRIGDTSCERVREVLDWEDEHFIQVPENQGDDVPQTADDSLDPNDEEEFEVTDEGQLELDENAFCDAEDNDLNEDIAEDEEEYNEILAGEEDDSEEDDESNDDDDLEFYEDDEEYEEGESLEETPALSQKLPPRDSTAILYSGRPSLLSFPKSLLLVAFSLGAGFWLQYQFEWILVAGVALALIIFIQAQLRRARHQYIITPKQVEVIHGLILENSREIRIEDIGAIHIRQRGFQGLLGLASIEFAAVDSPMPILVFYNVRAARRIKDLVRRLQDALEYEE